MSSKKVCIFLLVAFLLFSTKCFAIDVLLAWDGVSDPDLVGYQVFMRTAHGSYDFDNPKVEVGVLETEVWVNNLVDAEYAFVVRSIDVSGLQSESSNEVGPILLSSLCDIIPAPPHAPGGCIIMSVRNCDK